MTVPRWVLLVLLVLVLVTGGTAAVVVASKLSESQKRVRRELRAAAVRYGLDPDILDAIGYHESGGWRLGATNTSGADGGLGGAYGPTQITAATARANGFDGSMATLGDDAWLSAEWTARLLVAGAKNAQGQVLARTPRTLEDAAAWWNAGRQSAAELGETHRTRREYIPKVVAALAVVRGSPVA